MSTLAQRNAARVKVRAAHAKVAAKNAPPDWTKPLTQAQINKQATDVISASYKPVEAGFDQAESRAKSLDAKRAFDNQYYSQWVQSQTAQLQAHANAADQALAQRQDQIQSEAAAGYKGATSALQQGAAATPGAVSDPTQFKGFDLAPEAALNLSQIAANRSQSASITGNLAARQGTESASNFALMASKDAKRQADTFNALKGIADSRLKASLSKAADTSKEVARLLDREITKANANRDYKAALMKLQLDAGKAAETGRHNLATESIGQQNANANTSRAATAAAEADRRQRWDDINARIQGGKLSVSQANADTARRRLAAGATKDAHDEGLWNSGYTTLYYAKSKDLFGKNFKGNTYPTAKDLRNNKATIIGLLTRQLGSSKGYLANSILDALIKGRGG